MSLEILSRDVPLIAPVITRATLYWTISNLSSKDLGEVCHNSYRCNRE